MITSKFCCGKIGLVAALSVVLLSSSTQGFDGPTGSPLDPMAKARLRRFNYIWAKRSQQNVVGPIRPFVNDSSLLLRTKAVHALGELENPVVRPQLQALLTRMQTTNDANRPDSIPIYALQFALGRIDSRNLKGKAKVQKVLQKVGLTWMGFVQLTRTVNEAKTPVFPDTGRNVIEEIVDLLYSMGKRGEKVGMLANELTLTPAQQVMVRASGLPVNREVQLILDYLTNQYTVKKDDSTLTRHLVDLGPVANAAILARLQEMKRNPKKYSGMAPDPKYPGGYQEKLGYVGLFRAAGDSKDKRMMPLLKYFEKTGYKWVASTAMMARQQIELG